ncbi:hypothetical protein KAR91_50930 [Candidatus Pacearchaeota archaeon]|nr:hypothetical protein [Candidatus Pacearchaeota archaeon]
MQTSISKEQWTGIENSLKSHFVHVKFEYKGKVISINRVSESKTVLGVYIDGSIKGVWFQRSTEDLVEPLIAEVWRARRVNLYSPAQKKRITKGLSKRRIKEWLPDLDKFSIYYSPYFNTSRTLCSQFKKLEGLTLIEKDIANV